MSGGMESAAEDALASQVAGNHYRRMPIQPAEFITANGLGFCAGNVIKYVCRYKNKNGVEDLKKARHYIDLLIQLEYPKQEELQDATPSALALIEHLGEGE